MKSRWCWVAVSTVVGLGGLEWWRWQQLEQMSREATRLSALEDSLNSELKHARVLAASLAKRRCAPVPPPSILPVSVNLEPSVDRASISTSPVVVPDEPLNVQEPVLLNVANLDSRIAVEPHDEVWELTVQTATKRALGAFADAEVLETRCSVNICRVEFMAGVEDKSVDDVIDALTNMPEISGERLIQIDDSTTPAFATAYFGRGPSTSLAGR